MDSNYSLEFTEDGKIIHLKSGVTMYFIAVFMLLAGLGMFYFATILQKGLAYAFAALVTAMGGAMLYGAVKERSTIHLSKNLVTVKRTRAYKPDVDVSIPTTNLEGIYKSSVRLQGKYGAGSEVYKLYLVVTGGEDVELIGGDRDVAQVDSIRRIIKDYLNIPGKPTVIAR